MKVAHQLRLASGVVIASLVAMLAVALYVPARLNESAKQKFVREAIPLRSYVNDLVLHVAEEKAAADSYALTGNAIQKMRYTVATSEVNDALTRLRSFRGRIPRLEALVQQATIAQADLLALLGLQVSSDRREPPSVAELNRQYRQVDQQYRQLLAVADGMLNETENVVDEAVDEQENTYRQLQLALASLGTLATALALALFLRVPRRVGQLYESELRSRREAESRAEAARALEHVSDGVILTDTDGVIEFWNPAATTVTGIEEHAAVGRKLERLLPDFQRLTNRGDGAPGGRAELLPIYLGSERWLSVTSTTFGEGVVYAIRDVTEERALEELRSDFVTTASHELRTPLTSISGAARTLVRHADSLTDDRREAFLQMIVSESDRLERIVEQILLASRLEPGQIEVTSEASDAHAIAQSVVDAAAVRAPAQIRLQLDAPEQLHPVNCDPDRLRQVLGNLIDNAIKYSPNGGEIRVVLRANGDSMRFEVHDEGIGFEASEADAIFERFRRLDPTMTRGIGGTGLGLYICRELVERMGGRIWAESQPGAGASFYFELPLEREALVTQ